MWTIIISILIIILIILILPFIIFSVAFLTEISDSLFIKKDTYSERKKRIKKINQKLNNKTLILKCVKDNILKEEISKSILEKFKFNLSPEIIKYDKINYEEENEIIIDFGGNCKSVMKLKFI